MRVDYAHTHSEQEKEEEKSMPIVVAKDNKTKIIMAKVVPTEVADANHADSNPLHASTSVNFSSASDTSLPATLQRARTCPTCGFARIVSTSMRN